MMSNIMLVDKDNTLFEAKKIAETFFFAETSFFGNNKKLKVLKVDTRPCYTCY